MGVVRAIVSRSMSIAARGCARLDVLVLHLHLAPLAMLIGGRGARVVDFLIGIEAWTRIRPRERRALELADRIVSISEFTVREFRKSQPCFGIAAGRDLCAGDRRGAAEAGVRGRWICADCGSPVVDGAVQGPRRAHRRLAGCPPACHRRNSSSRARVTTGRGLKRRWTPVDPEPGGLVTRLGSRGASMIRRWRVCTRAPRSS